MSESKPWMHPKYDVMNMADDDIVLASIAKLYKSEMRLAVAEVERLRAENERLKKAGDAMISEWSSGDEKNAKNFLKALVIWHNAKEGKQS